MDHRERGSVGSQSAPFLTGNTVWVPDRARGVEKNDRGGNTYWDNYATPVPREFRTVMKRYETERAEQSETDRQPPLQRESGDSASDRDPLSELHRSVGNQAVQAMAREGTPISGVETGVVQRQQAAESDDSGEPATAEERVDSAVGAETTGHSVGVNAELTENQVLDDNEERTIRTREATSVRATAHDDGVRIRFDPGLVMQPKVPFWPDPDVTVTQVHWSFEDQRLSVDWSAARAVAWMSDPGAQIANALSSAIRNNVPSRMREPGYDPFSDPKLPDDLSRVVRNLTASPPDTTSASFEASLMLAEEVRRPVGGHDLVVPSGTVTNASVNLAGGLPESPSETRVSSIELAFGGGATEGAELTISVAGEDLPVLYLDGATVHRGGAVTADYLLASEVTEAGFHAMRALASKTLPGKLDAARDARIERDPELREKVNRMIDENLEPMVRELVLQHQDSIPNVDLATVMGISR